MERMTDEYIAQRNLEERPITLTGALLHMGIYDRHTLDEYGKREGFSPPVKRLRSLVADAYEARLHGNSPTGAIFALKNMGWSDKQEIGYTDKEGNDVAVTVNFVGNGS
jgi:hypothetical protein